MPAIQQSCLRSSPFPETVFDAIHRAIDVAPALTAQQRQLFGARLLQSRR